MVKVRVSFRPAECAVTEVLEETCPRPRGAKSRAQERDRGRRCRFRLIGRLTGRQLGGWDHSLAPEPHSAPCRCAA